MSKRHHNLITQIETDVLDESKPLAATLRKCITLGGQAVSADLRTWAARELRGYGPDEELPQYRVVGAPILVDGVTIRHRITGERISAGDLPDVVAEHVGEDVRLGTGIGGIEALIHQAESADDHSLKLSLPGGAEITRMMNGMNGDRSRRVTDVYWSVSAASLRGVTDQVRTVLTELVAELRAGMADGDEAPSAEVANQAVSVAVHGSKSRITVTSAQASAGSVATIDAEGSAPQEPGSWTRSRRIGAMIVGLATIAGAVAAVLAIIH